MIQSAAMARLLRAVLPLGTCALLALGACAGERYSVGLESTVLAATIDYQCEGGTEMRVERAADARSARATIGGRSWTLTRVDSAAQEKYSEGATSLYLDGEIATMESEGRLVGGKCQSKVPMPRAPTLRPYDLRAPTF
jgi:membrane-bound inhibitor of C-type lysozyme